MNKYNCNDCVRLSCEACKDDPVPEIIQKGIDAWLNKDVEILQLKAKLEKAEAEIKSLKLKLQLSELNIKCLICRDKHLNCDNCATSHEIDQIEREKYFESEAK